MYDSIIYIQEKTEYEEQKSFDELMNSNEKSFKIKLYLYRNHARPLYFFDMTHITGQIFFCSTVEIFLHALSYYNKAENIMKECNFYKVSPYKLCEFTYDDVSITRKFYSIKLHKEVLLEY